MFKRIKRRIEESRRQKRDREQLQKAEDHTIYQAEDYNAIYLMMEKAIRLTKEGHIQWRWRDFGILGGDYVAVIEGITFRLSKNYLHLNEVECFEGTGVRALYNAIEMHMKKQREEEIKKTREGIKAFAASNK